MKKIILLLLFALLSIANITAQNSGQLNPNCQNYSSPSGFTTILNYVAVPSTCTTYLPLAIGLTPNISILPGASGFDTTCSTVNSGYVNFNNVAGAHENRLVKSLGAAYDKNFQLDFNLIVANSQTGNAFYPVLLSSNNAEPNFVFSSTACPVATPMDELIVSCTTPNPSSPANPTLTVIVKDNGVNVVNTTSFILTYGTPYYCSVRVFDNVKAELQVYGDCRKTILLYKECFNFPKTVRQLTFLQHSINSGGGFTRRSSGKVADVCLKTVNYDCCQMSILGNNVICEATSSTTGAGPSSTYSVSAGSDVSGIVLSCSTPGVSYVTNLDGSITITNWGTFTAAPKVVTITATGTCHCVPITVTMNVYVHPKLNPTFNFSGLGNTGFNLNNFTLTPVAAPMTGVVHQWEIYNSDSSASQFAIVRGPFWNTGTPLLINSATPAQIPAGQFYMVKHGMYFTDGLCGWTEKRGLLYVYTAAKMVLIDENENGTFIKNEVMQQVREFEEQVKMEEQTEVKIFPNPVNDILNIQSSETTVIKSIGVYNNLGQFIMNIDKPNENKELNVSKLSAGNYFIKIETEKGTNTLKFIKN
jgi:predicted  nucleic acid-binding Zn-ribbon protein